MICDFNNIILPARTRRAFTFIEVVTALMIISVITFGVLVVINQSVASMIENQARIQAFELARENMENLLASDSVSDTAEFGTHETNEDIQWETKVEAFDEPVKSKMWIRAVCSATYTDKNDEKQTIQLEHWLTGLTASQEKQILDQRKRELDFLDSQKGNPFGDDPDGLMQYSKALTSMGDYAGAAEALFQIIDEYPDSPLVEMAVNKLIATAWAALHDSEISIAKKIIDRLKDEFPDNPDVWTFPNIDGFVPGDPLPKIPPKFEPPKPPNPGPNTGPGPDIHPPGPDEPPEDPPPPPGPNPDWTPEQKILWDKIMNQLNNR